MILKIRALLRTATQFCEVVVHKIENYTERYNSHVGNSQSDPSRCTRGARCARKGEEETIQNVFGTSALKPRAESGLDCLMYAGIFP